MRIDPRPTPLNNGNSSISIINLSLVVIDGYRCIKGLVTANKAQILKESCGYPNYYTAKAQDIIPLITKDLHQYNGFFVIGEDYVLNGKTNWDIKLDKTKIATITPNKVLYIETWHES
jgi:hypothetical protein